MAGSYQFKLLHIARHLIIPMYEKSIDYDIMMRVSKLFFQKFFNNRNSMIDIKKTFVIITFASQDMSLLSGMSCRGVAQLVERLVWDQDVAGSNPVTPIR